MLRCLLMCMHAQVWSEEGMKARGVETGWRVILKPGELLYIPAGCPHALRQCVICLRPHQIIFLTCCCRLITNSPAKKGHRCRFAVICSDANSTPSLAIGINYVDNLNKHRVRLDATLHSLEAETLDQIAAATVATALAEDCDSSTSSEEHGKQDTNRRSTKRKMDEL